MQVAGGSVAGNVTVNGLLVFNRSDDSVYANALLGSGQMIQAGTGKLILDGDSSAFAGTTVVSAGQLAVGDAAHPDAMLGGNVVVKAAGTLLGHGTLLGSVDNAGVVQPGGSIGTLSVGGNYVQRAAGALAIEVSPTGASKLVAGGTATLNGALRVIYDPGTYSATQAYEIMSANAVNGRFAGVTSGGTATAQLTQSVVYGPTSVDLVVNAAAGNGSQQSVSPTSTSIVAPIDTSIFTAPGSTALLTSEATATGLLQRASHGTSPGDTTAHSVSENDAIWISNSADRLPLDGGAGGTPGFGVSQYQFTAGADWRLGRYQTGVALTYGHSDISEQATGDNARVDTLRASFYGAREVGPAILAAVFSYAYDDLHLRRPFGGTDTAEGDTSGNELLLGTEAALPLALGGVSLSPHVGWLVAYYRANGFAESGAGGQSLDVGADNARSVQPYAGVSVGKSFGGGATPLTLQLTVDYGFELAQRSRAVSVLGTDGTVFSAPGASLTRGRLMTGVSVAGPLTRQMEFSAGYTGWINTGRGSQQGIEIAIRYRY